ncbi:MAG: hypothetical protein V3S55_15485 [Nitrospiraceae bacterium]
MSKHPKKRTIMRALKINEISGVDVPAQEGAKVIIMKRNDVTKDMDAVVLLTGVEEGHSHEVRIFRGATGGSTGFSLKPETEGKDSTNHDHPWIMTAQGEIIIGMNDGHSHEVEADQFTQALMAMASSRLADEVAGSMGKSELSSERRKELTDEGKALPDGSFPIVSKADLKNAIQAFSRATDKAQVARHIKSRADALEATDILPGDGPLADLLTSEDSEQDAGNTGTVRTQESKTMVDKTEKTEAETQVADLTAQLDRANKVSELNDVEKAYLAKLDDAAKDTFLAKSAEDRATEVEAVVKAATDADPIVYTTKGGIELRKSAGEVLIALAKSNDELVAANKVLVASSESASYEKRVAEDFAHIPGDTATRVAMLKAIDGIEDKDQREAALNALKAQNEAMSKAFDTLGNTGSPVPGSASDELDKLAKAHQVANPGMSYEIAYDTISQTTKGAELYAKTVN